MEAFFDTGTERNPISDQNKGKNPKLRRINTGMFPLYESFNLHKLDILISDGRVGTTNEPKRTLRVWHWEKT